MAENAATLPTTQLAKGNAMDRQNWRVTMACIALLAVGCETPPDPQSDPNLPEHKAFPRRDGRGQIRTVIEAGASDETIRAAAAKLALAYRKRGEHFLVMFFDDSVTLFAWDGGGAVNESHRKHWVARVPVEVTGEFAVAGEVWRPPAELTNN